mmetsp:Transcript_33203/g.80092  ORF Transcript_33203/g.80092 Transcript_33203/m.80092 type:complete len:243 (+) Transcript_33203:598-1326(+)
MYRHFEYTRLDGIDNELHLITGVGFDTFLNHMVAVLVLNASQHDRLKFLHQVTVSGNMGLDCSLYYPTSVHIHTVLLHISLQLLDQMNLLLLGPVLECLLNHIVPEYISNQRRHIIQKGVTSDFLLLQRSDLKPLLNKPAAILIFRKIRYVLRDIAEFIPLATTELLQHSWHSLVAARAPIAVITTLEEAFAVATFLPTFVPIFVTLPALVVTLSGFEIALAKITLTTIISLAIILAEITLP